MSIGDIDDIDRRLERTVRFGAYLDSQWQAVGHKNITWEWAGISTALRSIGIVRRRHSRWATPTTSKALVCAGEDRGYEC